MISDRSKTEESGQGLVEFALVFPVVALMIFVLLELAFAFNAYQNVVYAARSGARAGAVYMYQNDCTQVANDQNRESGTGCAANPYGENVRSMIVSAMPLARNFDPATAIDISYSPDDASVTPTRSGRAINVLVTYNHRFITPMFDSGSLTLTGAASQRIEP